jgi:hypothetical protein
MSAIERVTDVLIEHRDIVCVTGDPDVVAYDILDNALSVEEMARAIDPAAFGPITRGSNPSRYARAQQAATEKAVAVRAAILGGVR